MPHGTRGHIWRFTSDGMPLMKGITLELPEVIGESGEWEAYVRTGVMRRRRDHLKAERLMVPEWS